MPAKILTALASIAIVFAIVVSLQPTDFRIARATTISAPAPVVFTQINDLHLWKAWSPWAKIDPAMKETHEGSAAGKGAIYHWVGNKEVGEGRMTVTESRPSDFVKIDLEFIKPFAAQNVTEFAIKPEGAQTNVSW